MKQKILLFLILNLWLTNLKGQGPWSLSIAYTPRIEHRGANIKNLFYYPLSPGIITDYKISNKISLSSGVLFHYEKDDDQSYGTPSMRSEYKTFLFEMPLQVNYHVFCKPNKWDPYIKTSLRYTLSKLVVTRQIFADFSKSHFDDSYFLWDVGAGLNLKVYENCFVRCQISYGLGINHDYKNFRYFEPLISFGYNFNKH